MQFSKRASTLRSDAIFDTIMSSLRFTPPPPCQGFRKAPSLLVYLLIHLFRTCGNFRPRPLKDRSPGHVKWPHLIKSLNARHSYTECPIILKLSGIDIRTSIYKMNISEFWYLWLKVRSFCDLSIISQWEKNGRQLFWKKTIRNTFKHQVTRRLDTLSRNIAISDPSPCR